MEQVVWFAQLNDKDNETNKVVRLGYLPIAHNSYQYKAIWDNGSNDIPALSKSVEGLKEKINEKWGKWLTFKWL